LFKKLILKTKNSLQNLLLKTFYKEFEMSDWVLVAKKSKKENANKYKNCSTCEITKIINNTNKATDYKSVSVIDNCILESILEKIAENLKENNKFIITPDNDKYEIQVIKKYKDNMILKQTHLHFDKLQKGGFKRHSHRFVRITW
jgi:uncharacterized protein YfcZ (UPF0381/DUF406 family)